MSLFTLHQRRKVRGGELSLSSKEVQQYINLNSVCLFVQQLPKRKRDQEAYLNYYASAYNNGRQLSHHNGAGAGWNFHFF